MYKLLPEEARDNVRREYLLRRTAVILSAFVLVLVVATVGLFPSYVLSKARQKEVSDAVTERGETGEAKELETWLSGINLRLKALSPKLDQDRPAEAFAAIIGEKGVGVSLNNLAWAKGENGPTISVSGIARDRQSLLAFEARLKSVEKFSQVTLPVSNLAKDKDIGFEIKLTLAKTP